MTVRWRREERLVRKLVCTLTSHWSLIRSRKHYPSDVIGGGVLAVVVTATAWKLRPPRDRAGQPKAVAVASRRERPGRLGAVKRSAMRFVTNRLLNHVTRPLLERGWWPRTQALIETTGRTTGIARRVPVGNGLRGEHSGSSPSTATAPTTSRTSSASHEYA